MAYPAFRVTGTLLTDYTVSPGWELEVWHAGGMEGDTDGVSKE